jgi:hypothetical protein
MRPPSLGEERGDRKVEAPPPPIPTLPSRGADRGRSFMPIALKHLPSPLMGTDRGRYCIRIGLGQLPSPSMGEGLGGGEVSPSSPHPCLPPPGRNGCIPPCQPSWGEGERMIAGGLITGRELAVWAGPPTTPWAPRTSRVRHGCQPAGAASPLHRPSRCAGR